MAALMAMESGVSYAASNDLMSESSSSMLSDPSVPSSSAGSSHELSDVSLDATDIKRVTEPTHTITPPSSSTPAAPTGWVNRIQNFEPANYRSWGERNAVGFQGKMLWAGVKLFDAADFLGEVFADFLGITDSRYQYVVDAYERHQHELAMEALEEESELQRLEERVRRQRAEEAKREETAAAAAGENSSSDAPPTSTTATTADSTTHASDEAIAAPPAAAASV